MGLFVRTLLIWLLALAVPAQGAAGVTMAFCSLNHPGGGSAAAAHVEAHAEHEHPGYKHERPGNGVQHGHPGAGAQPSDNAAAAADASVPTRFVQSDSHKCTACASCCSAAAILNTVLDVPVPALAPTVFVDVVPTIDVFIADGPDRPPRAFLA